jgi:hypothetical protein
MKDEEIIRKQALELHLKSISINDIADTLGKTRQWVHKWLAGIRQEAMFGINQSPMCRRGQLQDSRRH